MLILDYLIHKVSISTHITLTTSQTILRCSMCRLNSVCCCISKAYNLLGSSKDSLLLHLVQNCTLTYFDKDKYFSHTFLKCITTPTYNSFIEEFIITFHASIIFSTITSALTIFPSSAFIYFVPIVGLIRLFTFFVM